jgi:hypothetical protein
LVPVSPAKLLPRLTKLLPKLTSFSGERSVCGVTGWEPRLLGAAERAVTPAVGAVDGREPKPAPGVHG